MCDIAKYLSHNTIWDWIIIFLIVVFIYIVIYFISSLGNRSIVITKLLRIEKAQESSEKEKEKKKTTQVLQPLHADHHYYLPTASLVIKATAKVIITKSNKADSTSSISAELTELQLENKVIIEPDTKQLFSLKYNSFSFANDELRLTINGSGLLESISATTEDRISNIIGEISAAPKSILSIQSSDPSQADDIEIINETTQTIIYTNTFFILSEELQKDSFSRVWLINIDVTEAKKTTVDASFKCKLNARKLIDYSKLTTEVQGILTRPLYKLKLAVQILDPEFTHQFPLQYEILIPDPSVLIQVPIERSSFVKKIHTPKFSNGLLIENYINKPSEVEGALSIPINILKAIFSIPAQLLSFKIAHIQQETALEVAQQNLTKAQLQTQLDAIASDIRSLQQKVQTEQVPNTAGHIADIIKEVTSTQKEVNIKNELSDNLEDLKTKKQLLSQLVANFDQTKLTKIDIDNINNLQNEIQKIQTKIDNFKSGQKNS